MSLKSVFQSGAHAIEAAISLILPWNFIMIALAKPNWIGWNSRFLHWTQAIASHSVRSIGNFRNVFVGSIEARQWTMRNIPGMFASLQLSPFRQFRIPCCSEHMRIVNHARTQIMFHSSMFFASIKLHSRQSTAECYMIACTNVWVSVMSRSQ